MNYEIACVCGHTSRGDRRPRHQLVACGGCGRPLLVFPHSPYVEASSVDGADRGRVASRWLSDYRALPYWQRQRRWPCRCCSRRPAADDAPASDGRQARQRLEAGRRRWRRASITGRAGAGRRVRLGDGRPAPLATGERRQLVQWHRQADLLAHLSQATLEEIVAQGKLVRDPAEWEALFALHHRGRAVLFDDRVRRDLAGRPELAHHVIAVGDETVRVALDDLPLFAELPLVDEPRLIFGARLAHCVREQGGGWVVHFQPDSAVLLTDPAAAEACLPGAAEDELRATVERQQRWLDQLDGGR
ncbi:MAG: hypothetical protein U0736_21000 [Gemmataceae bacterium]